MQEAVGCDGLLFMVEFAHGRDSPIRISRWMDEEEEKLQSKGEIGIQYVILDLGGKWFLPLLFHSPSSSSSSHGIQFVAAVGSIDSSGIDMLKEINKSMDRKGVQVGSFRDNPILLVCVIDIPVVSS